MFLFKASKDTPPAHSLRLNIPPESPRAVRMICKLQTTESPGLVSSAHLGNSISQRGGGGESVVAPLSRPHPALCALAFLA